jgi:hypothetical protein
MTSSQQRLESKEAIIGSLEKEKEQPKPMYLNPCRA